MRRASRSRFLFAGSASLGSGVAWQHAVRAAEFQYQLGHANPVNIPMHVRLTQMANAVKAETNGRLEITIYPNGMLGSSSAMLSQLRIGALQMLDMTHSLFSSVVPIAQIDSIGFAFTSSGQVWKALDGPLGAYIRREMLSKGIYIFEKTFESGFRQMTTSTKPVRTIDDFAGLKVRTVSAPIFVGLFKALGAAPVPLEANELYVALQTHIADAQETPLQAIETYRLYEVQKYLSVTNHIWAGDWLAMNAQAFARLPSEAQASLERNARKYLLLERTDSQVFTASLADKLQRQGLAFNTTDLTGIRARLGPYYATWRSEFGPTAWGLLEDAAGKLR